MRITIIINSRDAGELDGLREETAWLREMGHDVRPHLTFESGDAGRMAGDAVEGGADLVIAAGGDGTVNEVANGIHTALGAAPTGIDPGRRTGPRLAIVPLGTGNDLASAMGIPLDVREAMAVALTGRAREVDVPMVGGRCFLNASTGGLGAEATEEAPPLAKRALGVLAYALTGAKKFVELRASDARFTAGGDVLYDGGFLLFSVGNSDRTGGGNLITPRAVLSDGLLDVCIVKRMTRVEFARLLPELRAGRHLDHAGVLYHQVERLLVESPEELSVNTDGEPLDGCRRLEYTFSRRRLLLTEP